MAKRGRGRPRKWTPEQKVAKAAAHQSATIELRHLHREEFDALFVKHCEAVGIDWTPLDSPQFDARKKLQQMVEQYPDLASAILNTESLPRDKEE